MLFLFDCNLSHFCFAEETEPPLNCSSVVINNTDTSLTISGTFQYYNITYLDRPVYKSDTHPFYLYFHQASPCTAMWGVGETVGAHNGVAYVISNVTSTSPDDNTGEWTLLVDGSWYSDTNTTVFCV